LLRTQTLAERWPIEAIVRKLAPDSKRASQAQDRSNGAAAFEKYIDSLGEQQLLGALLDGITPDCKQLMTRHTAALFGDVAHLQANFEARAARTPAAPCACGRARSDTCARPM
jgi:hypothetical protein